jgi:hypothetical protein
VRSGNNERRHRLFGRDNEGSNQGSGKGQEKEDKEVSEVETAAVREERSEIEGKMPNH